MYKLRFGRTYNRGNYQSDRIEVERDFTDEIPIEDAILVQIHEVEKANEANVAYVKGLENG